MNASTVALATGIQIRDAARWLPWLTAIVGFIYAAIAVGVAVTGTLTGSIWTSVGTAAMAALTRAIPIKAS